MRSQAPRKQDEDSGKAHSGNALAITPNRREAVDTNAFPVPRSFAGKISGEMAYKTPYMIWALVR
jgi:DsbC/DsbD-like thiol-disulfide interchange protein